MFLNINYIEAAVTGTVLAAVSPAVIVPRMIMMQEKGLGTQKEIPQMIMAGASVDDVFVIVMFTAFSSIAAGEETSWWSFASKPVSIIVGAFAGGCVGVLFGLLCSKIHMRDSVKALLILCFALFAVAAQQLWGNVVPFSGLIAVMAFGMAFRKKREVAAVRLSSKFSKIWIAVEILLFVLVGASVDIAYAAKSLGMILLTVVCGLAVRSVGVLCCLIRTKLNIKERLFCAVAYTPKATVQAAIGGIPLAMGLACGETVLAVAVVAILFTAPLGALAIDLIVRKSSLFKSTIMPESAESTIRCDCEAEQESNAEKKDVTQESIPDKNNANIP